MGWWVRGLRMRVHGDGSGDALPERVQTQQGIGGEGVVRI